MHTQLTLRGTPDYQELLRAIATRADSVVFSTAENGKYFILSELDKPFVYVALDLMEARRATRMLEEYLKREVVLMPEREDALRSEATLTQEIKNDRNLALYKMATGRAVGVVTTPEGLMQFFPKREDFLASIIDLAKDNDYDQSELVDKLIAIGYLRVEEVDRGGKFSLHGDRMELWAIGSRTPVRIEFFGDAIETIKEYAVDTKLSIREVDKLLVLPASDILASPNARLRTLNSIERKLAGARQSEVNILNRLADAIRANAELSYFYLPLFTTCVDVLPAFLDDPVIVMSDVKGVSDKIKNYYSTHLTRVKNYVEAGSVLKEHKHSYMSYDEVIERLTPYVKLGFNLITSSCPMYKPRAVFSIKALSLPKYYINHEALVYDLKSWGAHNATVAIYAKTKEFAKTLASTLLSDGLKIDIGKPEAGRIRIVVGSISAGCVFPKEGMVIIGYEEVSKKEKTFIKPTARKKEIKEIPKAGDYVVHDRFGIGLSEGVKTVETSFGLKDYFVVLYKDGDKLYVPPDHMDEIEKWTGSGKPTIHRIGSKEFERLKERVKQSAKEMAFDLLSLYEKRERSKGYVYSEDSDFQRELEESFIYEETSDQLQAVKDIKSDMESGKIMDRLLAGDVGYGKTEVALRAMFKTIWDGKQAALLCPTTILAEQHYNTISARLQPFGIRPVVLSRFLTDKQIKENVQKIASGEAQIIVATHRLLSSDVAFNDLGLLVLDEEQRFGVEHKEKIKALKTNVNVLTMTATPIPRTLHMALSGIRDISLLTEAPKNRIPVETYVTEYNDALAIDAIKREVARDGQVYILYNNVKKIGAFYKHLQELLPDVPMVYAHGQMSSSEMDDRIRLFYAKDARVLIATTIIENGIDIADANTLIVIDADRLGLSSLYQLRGRVGRSSVAAYAYFTVPEDKVLSTDAGKRLSAILECSELGSGFRLAERDLEIRGAGNVLGREQHGNMEKVGYDMYMRLIREAVDELKGIEREQIREVEVRADIETSIPLHYVKTEENRVELMRRAASLQGREDRLEYVKELTDVYGTPGEAVLRVLDLGEIKNIAKRLAIKTVNIGKQTYLTCYDLGSLEKGSLMEALSENVNKVALSVTKEPIVNFRVERMSNREKVVTVRQFLERAAR